MKKWTLFAALALGTLGTGFLSAKETKFPPQEFAKVKPLVCTAQVMDDLKAIHGLCTLKNFTAESEDLNGDGKLEWFFYGPSGECGAHGNCPLTLLKNEGGKWATFSSGKCNNDECVGYANALYSEILKTSHNGYRDLLLASDSGSFFWVKDVFEWDGKQYRLNKSLTTYFLYDTDKDRLVQVSKERWDNCSKNGKDCLP
jgi:hypothetical protein